MTLEQLEACARDVSLDGDSGSMKFVEEFGREAERGLRSFAPWTTG